MFVEDVARANVLVAEKEEANYQAFNVGTGIATTVLDFINCLAKVYGREVTPELRGEFRPGDVRHLVTDASRLKSTRLETAGASRRRLTTLCKLDPEIFYD